MSDQPVILSVRNLTVRFATARGRVAAVDDLSFDLRRAETLAIVGESGCGKSVTARAILRLLPGETASIDGSSRVEFEGADLTRAAEKHLRKVRGGRIGMVFQEPMTSLNPVFTVGWQIDEALRLHTALRRRERAARVRELLEMVELADPERRAREYPHQLSGGMRQRVMIAIALSCNPAVLIADEPTTALDVTIQAQVLALLRSIQRRLGTSIVLITHNLGVVAQAADRVLVMYAGRGVETASVHGLFERARHPYTAALLRATPASPVGPSASPSPGAPAPRNRLEVIPGIVPALGDIPEGCAFQNRCPFRQDRCAVRPAPAPADGGLAGAPGDDAHLVACHFPLEGGKEAIGVKSEAERGRGAG